MRIALIIATVALVVPFILQDQRVDASRAVYQFVEVETTVSLKGVETSSEHPEERRWYFSVVMAQPESVPTYSLIKKLFIPYFDKNIVEPAEKRGVVIEYYDENMKLNGDVSYANYATRAETEEALKKEMEYRKEQGGNIYSFEIDLKDPKGEATSKPKLVHRDKEQPNYEKK